MKKRRLLISLTALNSIPYCLLPFIFLLLAGLPCRAQLLQPGFDKAEYLELMKISARSTNSPAYYDTFPAPQEFQQVYKSSIMGLDNYWDLWSNGKGKAVISIRGTTTNAVSWLANVYAAMVPAKGELQLEDDFRFSYSLAENPRAAVHVGWLVSTAYLARDIVPKIDSAVKSGTSDFIIVGHSQGGAIAYLLTSYLYGLQRQSAIPSTIRFKTYCSAAPKPGNLYYAYDYEAMTFGGWAFNVVNAADWVPESPISIQTLQDFNNTNPFADKKALVKKQKFPNNLVLKHVYNQLNNPSRRAGRRYQKYLGKMASKFVKKQIPGYQPPAYINSNNYVRTGHMIALAADADYYTRFPDSKENIFAHHLHNAYMYLAAKLP
ncbi:lipase family protein [Flavihumibacter sp. ZG627]|uniref:lipase family protein n=1 Tax=Flavihumibacter sp. ZG627 TaxID=1463156 RepID=UPI0006950859|nr:lipase family protein [Flavihumibacter sp. ZG627]